MLKKRTERADKGDRTKKRQQNVEKNENIETTLCQWLSLLSKPLNTYSRSSRRQIYKRSEREWSLFCFLCLVFSTVKANHKRCHNSYGIKHPRHLLPFFFSRCSPDVILSKISKAVSICAEAKAAHAKKYNTQTPTNWKMERKKVLTLPCSLCATAVLIGGRCRLRKSCEI